MTGDLRFCYNLPNLWKYGNKKRTNSFVCQGRRAKPFATHAALLLLWQSKSLLSNCMFTKSAKCMILKTKSKYHIHISCESTASAMPLHIVSYNVRLTVFFTLGTVWTFSILIMCVWANFSPTFLRVISLGSGK